MSQQTINISTPNSGLGDQLRTAFDKINDNFDELYPLSPTADQKAAMGSGTGANPFVLNNDSRMTNSRTPSGSAGGSLTGTYPNPTLANQAVTLASMVNMATNTLLGRATSGTGSPEHLTAAQVRTILDVYSTSQTPTDFLALTDTPNSYSGQASKLVAVNALGTALEFIASGATYTDENAQDAIGSMVDTDGSVGTIVFTYTDATPKLSAVNKDNSVTNAKLVNVATGTMKGRVTTGAGSVEDLTPTQARSVMSVYSIAEIDTLFSDYSTTFLALSDAPSSYSGQGGKIVAVNSGATALEFIDHYNDEDAQDAVALILDNGSIGDINFSYNDVTPVISAVVKNDSITYAKIQNVTQARLLGRYTASTGDVQEISIGTGLALDSGTGVLSATASGGISGLTANRIPYATSATTIGDDSALTWDDTNNALTVNTTRFHSTGTSNINIFIGQNAGNFTTTSTQNVGIGFDALKAITNGAQNIAIGTNAGESLTTGQTNVAIGGDGALASSVAGVQNIAIGYYALNASASGDGNVAVGYAAARYSNGQSANTAVGTVALGGSSFSGSNNTALGSSAGSSMSSADNNVVLGYAAGDNITTGDTNVIIGSQIDAPSATANGQLSIQNAIFGTGNTGTGTTLSTGNIGLFVNNPGFVNAVDFTSVVKFHVKSASTTGMVIDGSSGSWLVLNDSSQSANSRLWEISNFSSNLSIGTLTDAGSLTNYFHFTRSGFGIGTSSFGTSATNALAMLNGTAPSTSITDGFQMYSNDIAAGNAAPHFRTEAGHIIKLYTPNFGSAYSVSNLSTDRSYDANATTLDEIADVLGSLITDLKLTGLIA